MSFRAVIFDLDGTLLDTLDDLADSANEALQQLGFPPHPTASYRYFVGDGACNLIARILPQAERSEQTILSVLGSFREQYAKNWKNKTKPYPGIPEMLDALRVRRIKTAVLSNKPDLFTKQCVTELLPRWRFDVVHGEREGIKRKPDPAGAFLTIAELGVTPGEVLYLGDTDTDMKTASSVGVFSVGALWGFRTPEELNQNGAQALIGHPLELLDLLTTGEFSNVE